MKRLLLISAAMSAVSFSCLASAEGDQNQDAIITIGERVGARAVADLTAPSSIITAQEIERRNHANVSDLLRSIAGVSVNRSGNTGGLTQVRLRGSEANHVLVIVDGVEVSNPNTGEFDFAGLRAEDIVKIEVLRGEQSALWGADAVGGVINIVTRAGQSDKSLTFSVEGGSFETGEAQASAVIPVGETGAALTFGGNVFTTEGYDISGQDGEEDGSESVGMYAGLNNVTLGPLSLSAKYSGQTANNEFDSDTDFDGRLNNTGGESETITQTARLSAAFNVAGFENLINLSSANTEQTTKGTSFPNDTTGKRTNLNWAAERQLGAHQITLLAETERETFSNFGGAGAGQNQEQTINNHALAADYSFSENGLVLSASARQDFNDRFDNAVAWRLGAGYAFQEIGGRVYGSVGEGIKNPTLTELFGFFPAFFVGNAALQPESSLGYNIGYEQKLMGDALTVSANYFRSDLENEIFTDFSVFPATANNRTSESKREGVELETRFTFDQISGRASASFINAEENGIPELRRPEFLASGTLTWSNDITAFTLSVDHTGSQIDTDFGTFTNLELDAFTLVGLNASYNINDIVSVSLRGENLLDERYEEVVGYASQGRGVYAGLRARF